MSLEVSFPDGGRIHISAGGRGNLLHPVSELHGQKAQRKDPRATKSVSE